MNEIATSSTMSPPAEAPLAEDLLKGAAEIAAFMGWSEREVYYLSEERRSGAPVGWPIFTIDSTYYARKSALRAFIEEREKQATYVGSPQR